MALGIDFGTTRCVVAASGDGRYPVASFATRDGYRDGLPAIAVAHESQVHFGEAADDLIAQGKGHALASIKREVSTLAPDDVVEGFGLTALELTAEYLRWVRTMLVEHSNLEGVEEDTKATVAVPANASSQQRYLTLEAFRRAGFTVDGLLAEPTAAAIEFAHRNRNVLSARSPKRYVVVYDLGGGTFDTAAVSLEGRRFELVSARGVARLGGADFDEAILGEVLRASDIDLSQYPIARRVALLEGCREAKEGLRPNSRRLMVDLGVLDVSLESVVLDTSVLYERCRPLIERTVTMVEDLFASLSGRGIDPDDAKQLGALYLVGGSVAFPALGRALRSRFGRKIQLAPTPHASTAVGLAIAADPVAGIFVREAMTRHFGVWREGANGRDKVFDPIILQDAAAPPDAPLVVQRRYRPVHAVGHLRFMECSELDPVGQPCGDLTPWDEIRFPYDASLVDVDLENVAISRNARPSEQDVVETYTHTRDGSIAVEIMNLTSGLRRRYELGCRRTATADG